MRLLKPIKSFIQKEGGKIGAIILEPLVLGSGGMFFYKPFVLEELYKLSKEIRGDFLS